MANVTSTVLAMRGGEESMRKGPWHEDEDERLITFVKLLGSRKWDYVARVSGLKRSGKSCRLRWVNYLRPNLKHGRISPEEEMIILKLHEKWGNKWSMIARRLPGRTDNEIKNYWRSHLSKKAVVVQDQGNFRFGKEDGGSNYKFPCVDFSDTKNSTCYDGCAAAATAAIVSDFDLTVTSASSPYETRLSDWISEFESDYQSEIQSQQDSNSTHSTFNSNPATWFYEENDLWGCSLGSLWNME